MTKPPKEYQTEWASKRDTIVFDIRNITTSIYESHLDFYNREGIIYDLSGRRMNQKGHLPSGLYIKNKKKFYISK